jgi:hypothetical protein
MYVKNILTNFLILSLLYTRVGWYLAVFLEVLLSKGVWCSQWPLPKTLTKYRGGVLLFRYANPTLIVQETALLELEQEYPLGLLYTYKKVGKMTKN